MAASGVPLRRPTHPSHEPQYHLRIKDLDEHSRWDSVVAMLPAEMTACWDHLANQPTTILPNERCHRLHGKLKDLWQYKPTTGHNYRVWYSVDQAQHIVLVTAVWDRHP